MSDVNTGKKINKKTVVAIIIVTVCVAIIALSAGIAGHTTYVKNSEALITNYNTDFKATTPQTLVYVYEDGSQEIDMSKIIKLSEGATFSVEKIQDEDSTVTKGNGTVIDLSVHAQRLVAVRVVSKNGVGTTDYRITLVPESAANNVVDFNVSDDAIDPDDIFYHYSGECDINLPTPTKVYTSAIGNTYEYDFLGWYTTADYEEGTEIQRIDKGTTGTVELYAKFADQANSAVKKDGYTYVTFGNYPQTQVTDYNLSSAIKKSSSYSSSGYFTYNGTRYYSFKPDNVPNLSANGYSAGNSYIFEVEPIEWRVLTKKNATPSGTVTLLATNILNCSSYSTNDETAIKSLYDTVMSNDLVQLIGGSNVSIDQFLRYFFDGDSAYGLDGTDSDSSAWDSLLKLVTLKIDSNYLKQTMDNLAGTMFTSTEYNKIITRTFSRYKLLSSGTETYDCKVWPLNYSEAINANYGFSTDYSYNDPLRKAMVTDFAACNGVYRATNLAHEGQGSWWLRSAGGTQGAANGNASSGYGYKDKRVAYVKYTGYVHAYGSLNNNIRSGVRPALRINYSNVA